MDSCCLSTQLKRAEMHHETSPLSKPAATSPATLGDRGFQIANTSLLQGIPSPGICGEGGTKHLILPISFCAPAARLAVIGSVSPWHRKMRDAGFDEEH